MTVSRDEIIWCYRILLGREPESKQAIDAHAATGDLAALRRTFMGSREFSDRWPGRAGGGQQLRRLPLDIPAIRVDDSATEGELRQCLSRIREAWTHLGETTPHFSVLTSEEYRPAVLEKNISKFWASGLAESESVERILNRHGMDSLSTKTCLEYGCGVGRVALGLAMRFHAVHACDISANHLALAKQRARDTGIANCHFHLTADGPLGSLPPCDVYYSRLVFQHNPPPVIARLVDNAIRALRIGGIALFQVPTYRLGYRFVLNEWLAEKRLLDMQMHCLPQRVVFKVVREAGGEMLEIREDSSTGSDEFISNTFVARKIA